MKGKNITYTPAEIVSAAKDGIVVSADGVYDYNQEKFQEQVNADILEELRNIQLRISDLLPFNINYAGSNSPGGAANSSEKLNTDAGSSKKAVYFENGIPVEVDHSVNKDVPADAEFTDTKNTAGATNSNLKLFLIGSTELSENPQTYSRDSTYIGSDGYLYSGNQKVITDISHKADKINSVTNVEYNDKKITKTINGNTSDIVSINKIKEDLELNNVTNDSQVKRSEMGVANGVATLGNDGKVPSNQLPGYVDDVIELLDMSETSPQNYSKGDYYYNTNSKKLFEALSNNSWDDGTVPSSGKIYTNLKNNKTYRWGGSEMAVISDTLAIGNTQGTAFDGKEGYDHVTNNNIHVTTEDKNYWNNKGTYSKPDLGIPKSDLHNDVLESLNKADTAIQQETDPTVSSWAKQPNKPSYNLDEILDGNTRKLEGKVDKVNGKGLSTNDYTNEDKTKLGTIELGAQVHIAPTASEVKLALNVGEGTSKYLREDGTWITPPNDNTTYEEATTLESGLMSSLDKLKLNNIEPGALVHIAPTTEEIKNALGTGNGNLKYLREDGTWLVPPDTTYLSKVPQENGYDVSLVTTGDKYTWNNKLDYISDLNSIRSNAAKGAEAKEELIDYDIFINLGLPSGTLWAKYNIGANKDTDYGNYYRYGNINKYNNNLTNYSGTENPLDASKDAATQTWGTPWHIPTRIQFIELIENTTYEWTIINGVNGGKFTALNGNYIFFPASGNLINGNLSLVGTTGDYLSSTPGNNDNIYCINISNSNRNIYETSRDLGCSVRAVCETYPNKLSRKVDKVSGKDLSTNDYTNAEKTKLRGIEEGALVHIAPTSTEVKNALGTTSGTNKYLREDGTWQVPNYTDVSYSNNKFSKTINGNSSDIVTVDTLKSDMNLNKVGNFKAISTEANLALTDTEKNNARTNIGAGTSSLVIGTTTGKAADGKVVNDHINNTSNPHNVTKSLVGLGNVTNDAQVKRSELGVANGVATLDADGHVAAEQLEDEYQDLTAGNIVGEFSDEAEVSFRPTAEAVDIISGKASKGAKLMAVKGNTVKWNQLINAEFVDMGLPSGTLWAKTNIDVAQDNGFAASEYQYECSFFSWGNTDGHNLTSPTSFGDYSWGSNNETEPYVSSKGATLTANITYPDDASRKNNGSPWKMPTHDQFSELLDYCVFVDANGDEIPSTTTSKLITMNNVVGIRLKSSINGNILFFVCAGYGNEDSLRYNTTYGYYWSSSIQSNINSKILFFNNSTVSASNSHDKFGGCPVRPVLSSGIFTDGDGHKYYVRVSDKTAYDLTLIYGAGNEPTTPEAFEADYQRWFGKPLTYEDYDAGSLRPVKMAGIKTTGFNAWDEEWELGIYNSGGNKTSANNAFRNTHKIKVLPGQTYYLSASENTFFWAYDSNGNYLYRIGHNGIGDIVGFRNNTIAIPDNVYYLNFCQYVTTYNHDICINLRHSGARDGEYEPYWSSMLNVPITTLKGKLNGEGSSVVVFPDGLKKAGSVYDEIVRRGNKTYGIKRVGSVDLGTLTWTRLSNASSSAFRFITDYILNLKPVSSYNEVGNLRTGIYDTRSYSTVYHDFSEGNIITSITFSDPGDTRVNVFDSSKQSLSAEEFKTSMSGVMLYYELETPEEYLLDDFELPQDYDVDDYGTEEVQLGENGCAPLLDLKYGINVGDTIKNLPHNYVSAVGEQTFTEAQKERARKNIDAVSLTDIAAVDLVIADAFAQQQAEINALRNMLTDISSRINISARLVDSEEYHKVGVPTILYCSGVPNASNVPSNWNSDTMGEWTGVPRFIGQMYIDISSSKLFMSKLLTNSTGDWFQV